MQTVPIGFGDGMNWYLYCKNNPVGLVDPSGRRANLPYWANYDHMWIEAGDKLMLAILCLNSDGSLGTDFYFNDWDDVFAYVYDKDSPGDFCDLYFDLNSWESWAYQAKHKGEGVIIHGSSAPDDNMRVGLGSGPLSESDQDAILSGDVLRPPQPPTNYMHHKSPSKPHYDPDTGQREPEHWHYQNYDWVPDKQKWVHGNWEYGGKGAPPNYYIYCP